MNAALSLKDRLLGTWRILAYRAERADGSGDEPMGPNLKGCIMYTHDGYMSVHLMRPSRTPYASGDVNRSTPEERAAAAASYFAYAGTYEVDDVAQTVIHHVLYSLAPNWVGVDQKRLVILEGNRLELRSPAPMLLGGEQRIARVIWEKVSN